MKRKEGSVDYHSYMKIERISPRLSGDCLTLNMDFQNVSGRNITAFTLCISLVDDFKDPILIEGKEEISLSYEKLDFESSMHIKLTDVVNTTEEPAEIMSHIGSVTFDDGEVALWMKPRKKIYYYDAFEKDRYKDQPYIKKLSAYLKTPVCFAEKRTDGWLCCCGRLNRNQDERCPQCLSERKQMLMECTKEAIKEDIRKDTLQYRKEMAKRKEEENAYKKRVKKGLVVAGILTVLLVIACFFFRWQHIENTRMHFLSEAEMISFLDGTWKGEDGSTLQIDGESQITILTDETGAYLRFVRMRFEPKKSTFFTSMHRYFVRNDGSFIESADNICYNKSNVNVETK